MHLNFGLKLVFVFIVSFLSFNLTAKAQTYNAPDGTHTNWSADDTHFTDTADDPTENNGIGNEDDAIFPPFGDIQSKYNSYDLDVLGENLVGDNIDVDTGALSLSQTDVSIPGNSGLPVAFGRTLTRKGLRTEWLGGWTPQIPYISRHYVQNYGPNTDRCYGDLYPAPIEDNVPSVSYVIDAEVYFSGFDLNIPGRNPGALAQMSHGGVGSPEFVGSGARMVTKNNWKVSCLAGDAVSGGDRFLATAPNGDKFTFGFQQTYFERTTAIPAENPNLPYSDTNPQRTNNTSEDIVIRKDVLFVTRLEDVHGNWVNYEYVGGRPSKIISNDGREIGFGYTGDKITSVISNPQNASNPQNTLETRTWSYEYNASGLHKVIQPDLRYWEMTTDSFAFNPWLTGLCGITTSAEIGSVTIRHPSGTTALFDFKRIVNGRTHMDTVYLDAGDPAPSVESCFVGNEDTLAVPSGFHSFAVIKKTLTLLNNTTQIWTRDYEEDIGSFTFHNTHPADTKKRTLTDPLGHKTVIHVNRRNGPLEGSIMKTEIIPFNQTVPIQTVTNTHLVGNAVGLELKTSLSNGASVKRIYNTDIVTKRNGDTFTKQYDFQTDPAATDFAYGSPREERSWSNFVISNEPKKRVKATNYIHYKSKWVLGNPTRITHNGRIISQFGYHITGLVVWRNDYGQRVVDYDYYASWERPDAIGAIKSVKKRISANESRWTYADDWKRGQPQLVTRNDGSSFGRTIDDNGWGTSLTDLSGNTTTYEHDVMGRLTKIIPHSAPSGYSLPTTNILYTFHSTGMHQRITTGNQRNYVYYDSLYRPQLELTYDFTTAKYVWTRKVHDKLGRLTFTSYPSPSAGEPDGMFTEYDALGRVTESRESTTNAATQYEYLNSHRKKVTDPEGNITYTYSYGYDGPDAGDSYLIRQPLDVDTFTFRNVHGEVTRVSQNGIQNGISLNKSQYFYYDSRRRLCRYRTPEGGDTLYAYNDGGEMTSYVKGQASGSTCGNGPSGTNMVSQSYDGLGRLKDTTFHDGMTPNITRAYDANSNLTNLNRGSGTNAVNWEYLYDSYNRITDEKLTIAGAPQGFDIAYLYNGLGHMYRKTLPSGRNISYFNDGLGRHNKVSWGSATYADTVNYHPSGQIQTLTYGNGQVFTQGLNSRRMPYTLKVSKNGTFAQDMQYNYDVNGRVQYQFNFLNTDDTRYYQYDALGRLKQANSNKWAQADYKYDALGNLRSKHFSGWFNGTSGGPRTVTNSYNSKNQVSSSNDNGTVRTIAYDTRGNVTTLGNLAFVYDASDQPTVVTGGANGNYVYDGNMKRVKSLIDGKTIYNVYDNTGRLVHVDEVTDGKETDYLHGMGQTLARIENDVFTYLHPDHLGSPQAGTKGQGNPVAQYGDVAWNEHYTPFGEALISNAANDNQGGFTGHIKDKATGLNYMQARYYDPKIGRFLSVDPVSMLQNGKPAQFNRYSYTWNDPINGFDPDGRETRLMVEAHHLDMDVVNGNMTMGERNEISQAQLAGAVAALGTKGLGSVAKQQVKSISQRIKTAVSKKLGGCFEAGTLILTKDGKRSIETISVGDIVWSTDPEKGESGWKAVVDTFVNDESSVWQLTFADNTQQSTILHRVTGGHPYWVLSKDVWSWKFVSELKAGMVVKTKSGNQLTVIDAYDTTVIKRTYNFEVQDFHTYYVGDEEILVHNTSKKKFKPKKRRRGGDRQKGDRFKDGDDAEEQFREIDRAQQLVRKGKSNQIIDDTTKSKQRADNALNDLKKRDHQRPPPKPPED